MDGMARKRMDKEDIFGNKISVLFSPPNNDQRDVSPHNGRAHTSLSSRSDSSREPSPVGYACNGDERGRNTNNGSFFMPLKSQQRSPDSLHQDHNFSSLTNSSVKEIRPTEPSSGLNPFTRFSMMGNGTSTSANNQSSAYNQYGLFNQSNQMNLTSDLRISPISHQDVKPTTSTNGFPNNKLQLPLSAQKSVGRVSPFISERAKEERSPYYSKAVGSHLSGSFIDRVPQRPGSPFDFESTLYPPNQFLDQQHNNGHFRVPMSRLESPVSFHLNQGVELLVTNLDQSVDINEMKKILFAAFKEHVMVLHISMMIQPDGTYKASVRLPTMQDAQLAISQLHRRRIGHKKIIISYTSTGKIAPLYVVKAEVASLLSDVPTRKMPLFKFRELFESRYHRSIGISELYKLNDIIQICDDNSGRMISLVPGFRATPSPVDLTERNSQEVAEKPFCEIHMPLPESQGWAECESVYQLPDVLLSLKSLAPKVHTLLDTHQGTVPLNSFVACYTSEFGELPVADAKQKTSAPLEHLLCCIPGVEIARSLLGIKRVQWLENRGSEGMSRSISPALATPLALFSREMVDLLKNQTPRCAIQFNKLIPSYHHHFGRQCRVADYGFTKLIDLLEAIPHVIEILGQGQGRLLTLTHKSQVKRFASDLLRVLKSLPSKQLNLSQFAEFYLTCFEKEFEVSHYGVCDIMDLVGEVSENLFVQKDNDDTIIGIPKREQTPEEIERTKQFASDVIDLLRHTPSCSLSFNKFIPSYHHHFGRQCRVSYYGFSKLIELLEAIPEFLEVNGNGEDKILTLTQNEKLKIIEERVSAIVSSAPSQQVLLTEFPKAYMNFHGHILHLEDFDASSVPQLIGMLKNIVKIEDQAKGPTIVLVNQSFVNKFSLRLRQFLLETNSGEASMESIQKAYSSTYGKHLKKQEILAALDNGILHRDDKLKLTPLYQLARSLMVLLQRCGGHMSLQSLESEFLDCFGVPVRPTQHGFSSMAALLQNFPEYFTIKGRRGKKTVLLNSETKMDEYLDRGERNSSLLGVTGFRSVTNQFNNDCEFLMRASPLDIFNQPIPSAVPSPELSPFAEPKSDRNLMGFETPFYMTDSMTCMTESEQMMHRTLPLCHPANPHYYQQTNFPSRQLQSTLPISQSFQRQSPTFAPMPPASWLSSLTDHEMLPSFNGSLGLVDSESDSSFSSPQSKLRPRSRIAAHFAIPLDN